MTLLFYFLNVLSSAIYFKLLSNCIIKDIQNISLYNSMIIELLRMARYMNPDLCQILGKFRAYH